MQQRGLTEEDKRLLRERFAQLQEKQQLEERVEEKKRGSKVEEVDE